MQDDLSESLLELMLVIYTTNVLVVNLNNQPQLWFFSFILISYIPVVVVHVVGFLIQSFIGLGLGREKRLKKFLSLVTKVKWLPPRSSEPGR